MDNDNKFPEQQAPAKNTDDAFVQVDKSGAPAIPEEDSAKTDIKKDENVTTLDKK